TLARDGALHRVLKTSDSGTTQKVVDANNQRCELGTATAVHRRLVRDRSQVCAATRVASWTELVSLPVTPWPTNLKVIINARTGSVVMNRNVTIEEAAVAHGNLSIVISQGAAVSQPTTPFGGGQTVVVPTTDIEMRQEGGALHRVKTSTSLAEVVNALNALGATPQDLLAILQAMQAAGALRAEIEII